MSASILRTGLAGLNALFGAAGGLRRGDTTLYAAPSHHFSSRLLAHHAGWFAKHNPVPDGAPRRFIQLITEATIPAALQAIAAQLGSPPFGVGDDAAAYAGLQGFFESRGYNLQIIPWTELSGLASYAACDSHAAHLNGHELVARIYDKPGGWTHADGTAPELAEFRAWHREHNVAFITNQGLNRNARELAGAADPAEVPCGPEHFPYSTAAYDLADAVVFHRFARPHRDPLTLYLYAVKLRNEALATKARACAYPVRDGGVLLDDVTA